MRRAAPLLNIPSKIYMHFAVVTVVITGCVAIFAGGESQKELKEHLVNRQAHRAELNAQAAKVGNRRMVNGLVDNRGSSSGYDGGEPASGAALQLPTRMISGDEPTTPWSGLGALQEPLAATRKTGRKLPPVLPPGAPAAYSGQSAPPSVPTVPPSALPVLPS